MKQLICRLAAAVVLACSSSMVVAGPVILGGDDLTDHGSRSGGITLAGQNNEGWLYIEKAVGNVLSSQTRAGTLTHDIVALGSSDSTALSGNAGAGIHFAALELGKSVLYLNSAAAINQFFVDLTAGLVNPGMLWFSGTGANNDLSTAEGAALTTHASNINAFGASGGGIMGHGSGPVAYGWLSALLPGLMEVQSCSSRGATLTAAGQAAFPGVSISDIDANAGPCHSSFAGNLGGLTTLAFDGSNPKRSYIIGGGAGTVIQCGQPGQPPCTNVVPEPGSLPLALLAALGLLVPSLRRRSDAPRSVR